MKQLPLYALAAAPFATLAHDGHGLGPGHWHATDVWGFVAAAAVGIAAIWFMRRK